MANKRRNYKKWLLFIGLCVIFILTIGIGYAAYLYNKTAEMVKHSHQAVGRDDEKSKLRDNAVDPVEDNVSILFIGVDTSEKRNFGEQSRSDALLLATFNKKKNSVKLLSIPRDSYVYVPEVGYHTKINHAHFFGGPKATMETVEHFLNIPVDYYIRVNFEAFTEVINSLDGIYYDVPYEIVEIDSQDKKGAIHLYPGYQKLYGEEALALARTRKYDNDLERGKRQQEIIKSIANRATSTTSIFKLDNVLNAIGENMRTNLTFQDMRSFLSYGLSKHVTIESLHLDGEGQRMDDGLWYFLVDDESLFSIQKELHQQLELPLYGNRTNDEVREDYDRSN